jgi:hypothetical protein
MHESALKCRHNGLRPIFNLQAHKDHADVAFYSCLGDAQVGGNCLVAFAAGQ